LVAVAAVMALVYGIALQFMPKGWPAGIALIGAPFVLLLMYALGKLVTDSLYVRLFPLPLRRIDWDAIESYYVRTYRPIREYGGWGIKQRDRGSGIAYNAQGNRGVRQILCSCQRVLIGSQQPESLEAAIADFVPQDQAATEA